MRCIIIEDEIPAQKVLINYISRLDNLFLSGTYQSAMEANAALRTQRADLVFMDINLPDILGIDFLKTLKDPPSVIITTGYPNYAAQSYDLDMVCDYLVKPFSFERFLKAVNRVRPNKIEVDALKQDYDKEPTLFVNIDKSLHRISPKDILYIESDKNYVTLVTESKKLCYLDSLKSWAARLPGTQFTQVHKSYIVNLNKIQKVNGNRIFIGNTPIPVGRTYKTDFLQKLTLL